MIRRVAPPRSPVDRAGGEAHTRGAQTMAESTATRPRTSKQEYVVGTRPTILGPQWSIRHFDRSVMSWPGGSVCVWDVLFYLGATTSTGSACLLAT